MPPVLVQLRSRLAIGAQRAGKPTTEADVALKLEADVDVYKPDGTPLLALRRRCVPEALCEVALPALRELKKYGSTNRGAYGGGRRVQTTPGSKNTQTVDEEGNLLTVPSAVVGYFDRQGGRFPFCRMTAFLAKEVAKWQTVLPMVDHVAAAMRDTFPERYAKQLAETRRTNPAFVIGQTPFTTLTVNNNVAGTIHQDKGDFKAGIGCISVVRRGQYEGAWLNFPEYAVGVDLRDGDLLFFNSHDWHGVTPFRNAEPGYERISIVYYFRSKMTECGSPEEERQRAAQRYGGISEES